MHACSDFKMRLSEQSNLHGATNDTSDRQSTRRQDEVFCCKCRSAFDLGPVKLHIPDTFLVLYPPWENLTEAEPRL